MKRILLAIGILSSLTFAGNALAPATTFATDAGDEVCKGIGAVDGSGNCTRDNTLTTVIRNIISIFSVIVGIIAVIMIIVAGFKYITANGDSSNLTSARQTLVYALVGLAIAALSQVIVRFVLNQLQ